MLTIGILVWQAAVAISIVVARLFSYRAMIVAALCWTAFTFLAVWAIALVLLQLVTVWCAVWLLSKLFGKGRSDEQEFFRQPAATETEAGSRRVVDPGGGEPMVLDGAPNADGQVVDSEPSIVERCVAELLASNQMGDETEANLRRFLTEAHAGRLLPDDLKYLIAFHAIIVGSRDAGQDLPTLTAGGTSWRLRFFGVDATRTRPMSVMAGFAVSAGRAIDRLDGHVKSQLEKQRANDELEIQLHRLRQSVDGALELGKQQLEIARRSADSRRFAEIVRDLQEILPKPGRGLCLGLTMPPVVGRSLPAPALKQRRDWLTEALIHVDQTGLQISKDSALLAAIDAELGISFARFIAEQSDLLGSHLAALAAGDRDNSRRSSLSTFTALTRAKIASGSSPTFPPIRTQVAPHRVPPVRSAIVDHADNHATDSPIAAVVAVPTGSGHSTAASSSGSRHIRNGKWGQIPKVAPKAGGIQDFELSPNSDIERIVMDLSIPHLVHFTRCENIPSIVQHGIMSVAALKKKDVDVIRNDERRWDGQLHGTSLSIAFPNYAMFYKYRELMPGSEWAVLLISRRVLWEKPCGFYSLNAADGRMTRRPPHEMKSAQALSEMFADDGNRRFFLRPYHPTDAQAEVMVYDTIEPSLIEEVAFETAETRRKHYEKLGSIDSSFAGVGKGLFAFGRSIGTK